MDEDDFEFYVTRWKISDMKPLNLFSENHKYSIDDKYMQKHRTKIKSIAWFSQILKNGNLCVDVVNDALTKMKDFLDQKECEKEEVIAELQLAYAFQNTLAEKQLELMGGLQAFRK